MPESSAFFGFLAFSNFFMLVCDVLKNCFRLYALQAIYAWMFQKNVYKKVCEIYGEKINSLKQKWLSRKVEVFFSVVHFLDHSDLTTINPCLSDNMFDLFSLPVLHQVTIVKLLTQQVVRGDSWVPTNGSPP